ncbi:MAG: hypothetical protein MJZ74_07380 [Muribaculaceae bacterium]|nr:hypothetical protein [Muribaculaceae bacterium]
MTSKNKKLNKGGLSLTGMLNDLFGGRFLSVEFFKKNFIYIVFVVAMMLMYISNKFTCNKLKKEVDTLTTELAIEQTDYVNAKAIYNSLKRESRMKAHVDSMHINVNAPNQPPFKLKTK